MKNVMKYVFTSLLVIMTAVFLYTAEGWNDMTALFPRVVGFPMLVVLIVILAADVKKSRRVDKAGEADDHLYFKTTNIRMARYFSWLIGFVAIIWAVGVNYAIPVYVFSYMKIEGRYGWLKCGVYAFAATAFVIILFERIFRVGWPEGALLRILNS